MTDEERAVLYYQELHDAMLSHNADVMNEFLKRWDKWTMPDDLLVVATHRYVCQNVFFTDEERAYSENWLRENGYGYLIKNIRVAQ